MGLFDFFKRRKKENQASDAVVVQKPATFNREGHVTTAPFCLDTGTFDQIQRQYIAFDIETTGLSPYSDRIIEIGAVKFVDGVETERYSTLVNPHIRISAEATAINHITNDMLAQAPSEEQIYPQLMDFLGDAIRKKTVLCAHNARFDMDFLRTTLTRLGYDADILYVDTLKLCRQYVKGVPNHKQGTIADYFAIQITEAHRAADDARVCGEILLQLMSEIKKDAIEQQKRIERSCPLPLELEICAYIQNVLTHAHEDITYLRFRKNSSNYVEATCLYPFLRFKVSKNGKYIIIPKEWANGFANQVEPCTVSEGGSTYMRLFFASLSELEPLSSGIVSAYQDCRKSFFGYIGNSKRANAEAMQIIRQQKKLSDDDVVALLATAQENESLQQKYSTHDKRSDADVQIITRDSVVVNAQHSRVPLNEILNLHNWEKGYDEGSPYYYEGEEARKVGNLQEAIRLFDLARYHGYDAPALYDSYAKAYRQMKDYENEIVICEEGMERLHASKAGILEARRDKAISLLFALQEREKMQQEKRRIAAQKKEKTPVETDNAEVPSTTRGRGIVQLADDGSVICEYETIAAAVRATGINSKSIRDAANGVQRHAGGYCWKYKDK